MRPVMRAPGGPEPVGTLADVAAQRRNPSTMPAMEPKGHIIWGGVEPLSCETSGASGASGSASEEVGEERKKKTKAIKNRAIRLEAIQMLSNSDTTPENSSVNASQSGGNDSSFRQINDSSFRQINENVPAMLLETMQQQHENGTCKPCLFLYETVGCKSSDTCAFCHLPHTRKNIARQSKGKRDRFRKLVARMEVNEDGEDEDAPKKQPLPVGRVVRPQDEEQQTEEAAGSAGPSGPRPPLANPKLSL